MKIFRVRDLGINSENTDTLMRMTTFGYARRLSETYNNITTNDVSRGFIFEDEKIPFVNLQRSIFKP